MPRVLLVTHYFSTHRGGVEIVAGELARRLAREHGWQIDWLASDSYAAPDDLPAGLGCRGVAAWNFIERRLGVPWPLWGVAALATLWRAVGVADVVHIHDALYPGSAAAALFSRLRGKPFVVTQHVGQARYASRGLTRLHALANRTLGRWVLASATRCIFISAAVREYFARFCRFRVSPGLVFNGVDTQVYSPADAGTRAALRREAGIPEAAMLFLFVGRFVEKKGLLTLRILAEHFPDDIFVLAGEGPVVPEDWRRANVRVMRGRSGATLAPLYRMADLLLLPSHSEGLPLVVQEAMACGTPVLVCEDAARADPAAWPLMFVEATGSPDTAERWAKRIRELRADSQALRNRRSASADFARDHWSSSDSAAHTDAALREAIEGRP